MLIRQIAILKNATYYLFRIFPVCIEKVPVFVSAKFPHFNISLSGRKFVMLIYQVAILLV